MTWAYPWSYKPFRFWLLLCSKGLGRCRISHVGIKREISGRGRVGLLELDLVSYPISAIFELYDFR